MKLLPCPFCGGSATMEQTSDNRWSVGCDNADEPACMGYQSFTTFARQVDAMSAWNTRSDNDRLAKALKEIIQEVGTSTRANKIAMAALATHESHPQ